MKRFVLVLFLAFAPLLRADETVLSNTAETAAAAAGDLETRIYRLKFKEIDRAASLIKSVVSAEGSISLQPASRTIVITDRSENLRRIVQMLDRFDVAPQAFTLELKLATAARGGEAKVPEEFKSIASKLAMLGFTQLEKVGESVATGKEGDASTGAPGSAYRIDFQFGSFDPASETIRVNELRVQRVGKPDANGIAEVTQLFKTSLNVRLNQETVLGVARDASSNRTLMLVVTARRAKQ